MDERAGEDQGGPMADQEHYLLREEQVWLVFRAHGITEVVDSVWASKGMAEAHIATLEAAGHDCIAPEPYEVRHG